MCTARRHWKTCLRIPLTQELSRGFGHVYQGRFEMNTYSIWGHFDLVVGMPLGYNVPYSWDGNIFGGADFEAAISVTFQKLKGSSKVMVLPG